MTEIIAKIRLRGGTAAQWADANPILAINEIGLETDTNLFKRGNGSGRWNDLGYFTDSNLLNLIAQEKSDRESADTQLQSVIDDEINDRQAAISQEVSDRQAADAQLQENIDNSYNILVNALTQEISDRENADVALSQDISNEASSRQQADSTLQTNIDNEATERTNADTTLQNNINSEATARQNADLAIQNIVDLLGQYLDAHVSDNNNPHATTLEQARLADNFFDGEVDMNGNSLRNIPTPTNSDEAVNKAYVDGLIDNTLKPAEAYNPTITSLFPTTYGGSSIKKGDTFRISAAGVVNGVNVDAEDLLIANVNTPGQTVSNWQILESNREQATESVKGVAKISAQAAIENELTSNNTDIVTPQKFWFGINKMVQVAWTWTSLQTYLSGIKTSLLTNDDGEFRFSKTTLGSILLWTNGRKFRFSATVGGAPSMEIDETTGKVKLLNEVAGKLLELDSNKGASSISVSKDSIIKSSFDIAFDGQGGVISVNANAIKRALACAGNVTAFSLKGDASGSIEIDMKKNGVSMVGAGNKIDLISQSSDTGLPTSWTSTAFAIDDELEWTVTSATTITKLWLTVKYDKTS